MFTTGSKLFVGATALSIVGAVVWGICTDGPVGLMGTVGLISVAVVFAFLAGINFFTRDGNVPSMQQGAQYTAAAAQPPAGRSMWPLASAVAAGGIVVGAVSRPVVFKVAVVVLLAAIVEWMIQGWSERASADATYNAGIRKRLLNPLEFPILAAGGLGALIYGFSRVMLRANKDAGKWVFVVLAALILGAAFLIAFKRGLGKATIAGVASLGAVAIVGAGVVSALQGQRTIETHSGLTPGVCLEQVGEEQMHEADHKADTGVSAQSSVVARIELQSNGTLIAWVAGYSGEAKPQSSVTIARSAQVGIVFENNLKDGKDHRLTARLGTFGKNPETILCTARIGHGDSQFLSFKVPKVNAASSTPLELFIPDLPDQKIQLVVP